MSFHTAAKVATGPKPSSSDATSTMGLGSAAYSGMSDIGRIQAYIGAVVGVLVMLLLFYFGYLWMDTNSVTVTGTITKVNSTSSSLNPSGGNAATTYVSHVVVSYSYKGPRSATMSLSSTRRYRVGDTVSLSISPSSPDSPQKASPWWFGPGMIGLGFLIGASGLVNAYLVSTSKAYAAAEGTAATVGMVAQEL